MTWQNKIENMSNLSAFSINFCTFCLKKQHAKQGIQLCYTIFRSSVSHSWKKYTQHYIHPNHVLYRVSLSNFYSTKRLPQSASKNKLHFGEAKDSSTAIQHPAVNIFECSISTFQHRSLRSRRLHSIPCCLHRSDPSQTHLLKPWLQSLFRSS